MSEPAQDRSSQGEPAWGRHTIFLNGRDSDRPKLTYTEAWAMHEAGIRFSIFDPVNDEYNVSRPYKTLYNIERGTLTFVQEPPK